MNGQTTPNITLYHNPHCSKSREALTLLQAHGIQPRIIPYLQTPPDAAALRQLLAQTGGHSVRDLMRRQDDLYQRLKLDDESQSEQALIDAILTHPALLERPIAVNQDTHQARVGRPPQRVLELLALPINSRAD